MATDVSGAACRKSARSGDPGTQAEPKYQESRAIPLRNLQSFSTPDVSKRCDDKESKLFQQATAEA